MASDRNTLATLLNAIVGIDYCAAREGAERTVRAGWRPPARVIEDLDELEALPAGAIVLELDEDTDTDPCPTVWSRFNDGEGELPWAAFGNPQWWDSSHINLPVRILHIPAETGDTDAE